MAFQMAWEAERPQTRKSREGDRALQQLLETGFSARSALKMVNTILLLTGLEQHPATLDLCCVDLCSGVLEAMKDGSGGSLCAQ